MFPFQKDILFKTLNVEIVYPVHGKSNFNENYIL